MKLVSITGYLNAELHSVSTTFCGDKVGSGVALIPIKITAATTTTMRVEVSSATQVSKKGLVSAVIKVSVPYVSLTTDANGNEVVDPRRAGYNSFHTVVNLNKYCVEDASGRNGALAQEAAFKQILGGLGLRMRISGPLLGGPTGAFRLAEQSGGQMAYDKRTVGVDFLDADTTLDDPTSFHHVEFGSFDSTGTYDLTDAVGITPNEGPFARILAGLSPLGCDDVKDGESYQYQTDPA